MVPSMLFGKLVLGGFIEKVPCIGAEWLNIQLDCKKVLTCTHIVLSEHLSDRCKYIQSISTHVIHLSSAVGCFVFGLQEEKSAKRQESDQKFI